MNFQRRPFAALAVITLSISFYGGRALGDEWPAPDIKQQQLEKQRVETCAIAANRTNGKCDSITAAMLEYLKTVNRDGLQATDVARKAKSVELSAEQERLDKEKREVAAQVEEAGDRRDSATLPDEIRPTIALPLQKSLPDLSSGVAGSSSDPAGKSKPHTPKGSSGEGEGSGVVLVTTLPSGAESVTVPAHLALLLEGNSVSPMYPATFETPAADSFLITARVEVRNFPTDFTRARFRCKVNFIDGTTAEHSTELPVGYRGPVTVAVPAPQSGTTAHELVGRTSGWECYLEARRSISAGGSGDSDRWYGPCDSYYFGHSDPFRLLFRRDYVRGNFAGDGRYDVSAPDCPRLVPL